jgi:hypothetical protein
MARDKNDWILPESVFRISAAETYLPTRESKQYSVVTFWNSEMILMSDEVMSENRRVWAGTPSPLQTRTEAASFYKPSRSVFTTD